MLGFCDTQFIIMRPELSQVISLIGLEYDFSHIDSWWIRHLSYTALHNTAKHVMDYRAKNGLISRIKMSSSDAVRLTRVENNKTVAGCENVHSVFPSKDVNDNSHNFSLIHFSHFEANLPVFPMTDTSPRIYSVLSRPDNVCPLSWSVFCRVRVDRVLK